MNASEKEDAPPTSAGCGGCCPRCCGCGRCRGEVAPEYVVISSFVWPPWPDKNEKNPDAGSSGGS